MPTRPSPYYTPQGYDDLGSSLATALFGNPELAARQRQAQADAELRRAQTEEATQHGNYYQTQADAGTITNNANRGLPETFAGFAPQPVPPTPLPGAGALGRPDVLHVDPQQFRANLPGLFAQLIQGGHAAQVDGISRALGAFSGDDGLARAGLIAGGASPTKDFAITSDRADQIAANTAAQDRKTKFGVADIAAGASRYGADVGGRTRLGVAGIQGTTARDVARIHNEGSAEVAGIKAGARSNSLADGILSLYPGAYVTSGDRTQAEQNGLRASGATTATHSDHVPGNSSARAIDVRPIPGKSLADVVSDLSRRGYQVVDARAETGQGAGQGTAPHWHIAAIPPAGAGKPAKTYNPKLAEVQGELARQLGITLDEADPKKKITLDRSPLNAYTKQVMLSRAIELAQQSGNIPQAVRQAFVEHSQRVRAARGGGAPAPQQTDPSVDAARSAFGAGGPPAAPRPLSASDLFNYRPAPATGVKEFGRDKHGNLVRVR